jgi:very-short-patch-repair endonuclease
MRSLEEQGQRVDSIFEKLVLERLMSAGYRVQTQVAVGSFRIDLVVSDETGRRLAIECGGEQWHTQEQLQTDLERQAVLERQGWIFTRIRGSVFFRDQARATVPVFTRLRELGIEPQGLVGKNDTAVNASELIERVRRSAEGIREGWRTQERRSA